MKCRDMITSLDDVLDKNAPGYAAREFILPSILPSNKTYDDLPNRTAECELSLIGKPVYYHGIESEKFGAFLRDPIKVDNITVEKVWYTKESNKKALFEYRNKIEYQKSTLGTTKIPVVEYKLPCAYEVIENQSGRNVSKKLGAYFTYFF